MCHLRGRKYFSGGELGRRWKRKGCKCYSLASVLVGNREPQRVIHREQRGQIRDHSVQQGGCCSGPGNIGPGFAEIGSSANLSAFNKHCLSQIQCYVLRIQQGPERTLSLPSQSSQSSEGDKWASRRLTDMVAVL
uniref:Uncharacterized protein n=1 Tax=Rousettus aegyptiacus TaxID=9407 RepID=A0A7J8IL08_ROUAE|nr:hypothetical protein HJG63_010520 [Rousettus aegyptiacus]